MRLFIALVLLVFSQNVFSEEKRPLHFPAEKNYLKVIPQIFEYSLLDDQRLQIGNVIFNAQDFRWIRDKDRPTVLRVSWPQDWIVRGEISLQDPAGKNLLTKAFDSSSSAEIEALDGDMISQLSRLPFFKICLFQLQAQTRFYLCSPELALDAKGQIFSRRALQSQTEIDINGRMADRDGKIYLNLPTEFISLRLRFSAGASLEIETRMKPIEYYDVVEGDTPLEIRIRALGPPPLKANKFKKLDEHRWEAVVERERPFLYIISEAGIPLRQEFHLQGPVRPKSLILETDGQDFTFSSQDKMSVFAVKGINIAPADNRSELVSGKIWILKDLEPFATNERLLKVNHQGRNFVAAYDIQRVPGNEVSLSSSFPFWVQLHWHRWINRHHSLGLSHDQQMSKESSEPSVSATSVTYHYFPASSFPYLENNFAATISYTQQKMESENFPFMSIGILAHRKTPDFLQSYADWIQGKIEYGVLSLSSKNKIESPYDLKVSLKKFLNPSFSFEYGLRLKSLKTNFDNTSLSINKTFVHAGLSYLF